MQERGLNLARSWRARLCRHLLPPAILLLSVSLDVACAPQRDAEARGTPAATINVVPGRRPNIDSAAAGHGRIPADTGRIRGMPGERVRPISGPARDSASAVRIATAILNRDTELRFAVSFFVSYERGFLIELMPNPPVPGGSGLLWIEPDGSALILRRGR